MADTTLARPRRASFRLRADADQSMRIVLPGREMRTELTAGRVFSRSVTLG